MYPDSNSSSTSIKDKPPVTVSWLVSASVKEKRSIVQKVKKILGKTDDKSEDNYVFDHYTNQYYLKNESFGNKTQNGVTRILDNGTFSSTQAHFIFVLIKLNLKFV